MIETSRYDRGYEQVLRKDRRCPPCESNQIKDEIHFLFICPKYSTLREEFFRKIKYHVANIKQLSISTID